MPYFGNGTYNLSAGTYTYSISDNNGCPADVTFMLTEPDSLIGIFVVNQPSCINGGGSVTVNVSGGTSAYNIYYASGSVLSSAGNAFFLAQSGFNTVQIYDAHGCETDLDVLVNSFVFPIGFS